MNAELESKLNLLDKMISALGKVINVQLRLEDAGETKLADELRVRGEALIEQIETLRRNVNQDWIVSAEKIADQLKKANSDVQRRIRQIQRQANITANAAKIIEQLDEALGYLKKLL